MRLCGICKRPPREGENMHLVRLRPEFETAKEPGLYQACQECRDQYAPAVARYLGCEVQQLTRESLM